MKKQMTQGLYTLALAMVCFTACKKDQIPVPNPNPKPHTNPGGQPPPGMVEIKLQAVITIGAITYDSLPANFRIISWDAQGAAHQKDTLLAAGVNKVPVRKGDSRYQISVNKWGISDVINLTSAQLQTDVVYTLGGGRAAKRLKKEETYIFASAAYQARSKVIYTHNNQGVAVAEYYQKLPEYAELQWTQTHRYAHTGNNVTRIDRTYSNNTSNFTSFDYNAQATKVTHIHEVKASGETYAAVEYGTSTNGPEIMIDYLFDNGHAMEYKMLMKGGNKVSDEGVTSRGGREGGTYQYDLNINPYAHMNMPNLYLSNLSKNNLTGQNKGYSGSIPSAEPYKFEYKYDAEGYPVELIKYYKNYLTGEELYKMKTVYIY